MAELLPIASGKTTWKLIARTVFNHPARFTYILCLFIASSLVALVTPWQIGLIVDRAIAAELAGFPWRELAFIAAATLANALITRTWIFQAQNLGTQMNKELGIDLVGSALDLDAQTVEDAGAGDLVSRVTDDLDSVRQIITMGLPEIIHVLISIFTIVVSIFVLSPALGAMTLPFLVLETCVIAVFLPRIARRIVLRTERISTMTTTVTENVHGAATASELGVVDARARVLERNIWDYYEVADGLVKLRARLWALDSIAAYSPLFLSVAWGAICVRNGWASWGQVSTASILVFTMRTNADIFSYWLDRLREMTVTMGRVSGVIDLARTHRLRRATQRAEHSAGSVVEVQKDAAGAAQTAEFDGAAVRVRELTFGYDPAKPVLEGIDFSLKQGEMVALVGRSGSGKTTLARLMAGSLSASSGTVEVMGEPVGNGLYPTQRGIQQRPHLLICTQEAHLFLGTLADNLTLVAPDASETQMLAALRAVGADWVDSLPEGVQTRLGGGHCQLSRDQVQQLALARIVLADPHVVILDESTTQLELADARQSLEAVRKGRAVVIISHDARIASLADRAVLLSGGQIVAEGRPEQIFARA